MKTVVLLYDTSCIYEIVILNYFLKVTGKEMQFVSLDGKEITTTEGYRIVPEDRLILRIRRMWNCWLFREVILRR